MRISKILLPRSLLLFLLLLPGAAAASERFVRTQILMGDVPVTFTIEDKASRREATYLAMEKAFDEARRLENSVSEWRPGSQATLLNRNAGKALVPVDRDMQTLLLKALEISETTDGAFDITFASCKGTPQAGPFHGGLPCPYDYRDVIVLPELGLAYLRPGATIGVSGIAKGFIVDAMVRVLRNAGFRKFLVNAGDLYAAGRWTIGIRDPEQPGGDASICQVTVKDRAVSTSGQYERGAHIVDPKTRKPATVLKSATVIAKTSTEADALATGLFVLGSQRGAEVVKEKRGIDALFVGQSDETSSVNLNPSQLRCRRSK